MNRIAERLGPAYTEFVAAMQARGRRAVRIYLASASTLRNLPSTHRSGARTHGVQVHLKLTDTNGSGLGSLDFKKAFADVRPIIVARV